MKRTVRVGQLWQSRDERDWYWVFGTRSTPGHREYRMLRVILVNGQRVDVLNERTGKKTTISRRRLEYSLGCRGYELIKEAQPDSDYQI